MLNFFTNVSNNIFHTPRPSNYQECIYMSWPESIHIESAVKGRLISCTHIFYAVVHVSLPRHIICVHDRTSVWLPRHFSRVSFTRDIDVGRVAWVASDIYWVGTCTNRRHFARFTFGRLCKMGRKHSSTKCRRKNEPYFDIVHTVPKWFCCRKRLNGSQSDDRKEVYGLIV